MHEVTVTCPEDPLIEQHTSALLQNNQSGADAVFLAIKNDKVVGFSTITHHPNRASAQIDGLYVQPDNEGQGLGVQLIRSCIQHAKHRGAEDVSLSVRNNNLKALSLYQRFGFEFDKASSGGFPETIPNNSSVATMTLKNLKPNSPL